LKREKGHGENPKIRSRKSSKRENHTAPHFLTGVNSAATSLVFNSNARRPERAERKSQQDKIPAITKLKSKSFLNSGLVEAFFNAVSDKFYCATLDNGFVEPFPKIQSDQ
jgi:hypothetical protein